jgi:hypothetical protein
MAWSIANTTAASPGAAPPPFRELLADASRYWEPRRIGYNVALAAIVLGWVVYTWPAFRSAATWQSLLLLFVLAVLANACYCAAYLVDLPMQYSAYRDRWRRRRWALWVLGTLFAAAIACYWIGDEVFPSLT